MSTSVITLRETLNGPLFIAFRLRDERIFIDEKFDNDGRLPLVGTRDAVSGSYVRKEIRTSSFVSKKHHSDASKTTLLKIEDTIAMKSFHAKSQARKLRRGIIFFEYILLVTIIGIGAIVGLAAVRHALVHELKDVAYAIHHIHHHHGGGHDHGDDHGRENGHGNGHGGHGGNGNGGHENGHGNNGNGNGHGGNGNGGHENGHGNNGNGNGHDGGGGDNDE